jgi:hypothetical protein
MPKYRIYKNCWYFSTLWPEFSVGLWNLIFDLSYCGLETVPVALWSYWSQPIWQVGMKEIKFRWRHPEDGFPFCTRWLDGSECDGDATSCRENLQLNVWNESWLSRLSWVGCLPLESKFTGSKPVEDDWFLRAIKHISRLPSEGT